MPSSSSSSSSSSSNTLQKFSGNTQYAVDTATGIIHTVQTDLTTDTVTDLGEVVFSVSGISPGTNFALETGGNLATVATNTGSIATAVGTIATNTGAVPTPTATLEAVGTVSLTGSAQELVTTPTSGCTGVWLQPPLGTDGSPSNQQTVYWGNSSSQVFGLTTSNGGTFIKVSNPSVLYVKGRSGDSINYAIIQ